MVGEVAGLVLDHQAPHGLAGCVQQGLASRRVSWIRIVVAERTKSSLDVALGVPHRRVDLLEQLELQMSLAGIDVRRFGEVLRQSERGYAASFALTGFTQRPSITPGRGLSAPLPLM